MSAYAQTCGPTEFGFDADEFRRMMKMKKRMFMAARRHGGPGGPDGPWRGFGPGMGRGFGFGPRGRAGRGDVRTAVLALLSEGPRHGYQMIQEIAERSGGAWKPSPGSIYPVLSSLQDEGLVDDEKIEGRRVFSLTEAGQALVAERAEEIGHVFDANSDESEVADVRPLIAGIASATMQVFAEGSTAKVEKARAILVQARKELYLLLAEDDQA